MNVYEISKIKQYNMGYSKPFFDDLEKLFEYMGPELELEDDELNEFFWGFSWSELVKSFFKPTNEETWYDYYETEDYATYQFTYEGLFRKLMDYYGLTVIDYEEAITFSNSGLDIYVMSFVVSDGVNIYTSFNNVHERY